MKKILLMAVCIIMMSMTASAISINKALLDHDGSVTLYDGLQEAINASADGDVIYLTLGTFKGSFTVSKKITIRGTGETTIIDGDVSISIPGSPKLTSPVMEALTVSGTVTVGAQVDDMILRKCKITKMEINAQVDGAVIDRCNFTTWLGLSSYIKGMTVVNTYLNLVYAKSGATSNTTFVNCYISKISESYFSATIINSILYAGGITGTPTGTYNGTINSTVLLNTLINTNYLTIGSSSVAQNCYKVKNPDTSKSSLQSNNYLGTDGTVVGYYGGDTPFTLEPSVPKVTSSSLDLDMEKKELNVKLTVSPQ